MKKILFLLSIILLLMSSCSNQKKLSTEGVVEGVRSHTYLVGKVHHQDYFVTIRGEEYQVASKVIYPSLKTCQKGDVVKVVVEDRISILGDINVANVEILSAYKDAQLKKALMVGGVLIFLFGATFVFYIWRERR